MCVVFHQAMGRNNYILVIFVSICETSACSANLADVYLNIHNDGRNPCVNILSMLHILV